jgi:putative FmdB family regulatory protein
MPIYEYHCAACGHHLEALQKMSDGPLRKCPECGKSQLRRLVSASRFRLAGSGWYETDFKGDAEKKRNLVEKGEPGDAGAKTEEKKEAAAETKAASTDKPKESTSEAPKTKPASTAKRAAPARKPAAKPRTKPARA